MSRHGNPGEALPSLRILARNLPAAKETFRARIRKDSQSRILDSIEPVKFTFNS
jgi:hypothetical protein